MKEIADLREILCWWGFLRLFFTEVKLTDFKCEPFDEITLTGPGNKLVKLNLNKKTRQIKRGVEKLFENRLTKQR